MKTTEEFQQFYQDELLPDLKVFEERRKQIVNKIFRDGFVVGTISLLLLLIFKWVTIFFVGLGGIAILLIRYHFHTKGYITEFRKIVITKIVHFIDQNLTYSPTGHIPITTYMKSKLFPTKPDNYEGHSHVHGMMGETEISFSQIDAEYESQTQDDDGNPKTEWHTIFKGLFFVADFNKSFQGETVILPDEARKFFGEVLGSVFQSWDRTRGKLVRLEDPEFEKLFVVYGTDQIEARYLLSASLMKRIVDFRKKADKGIRLSFVENRVFVAISYGMELFESKVFDSLTDIAQMQKYYEVLQTAVGIVEDLNLNRRIWSKS